MNDNPPQSPFTPASVPAFRLLDGIILAPVDAGTKCAYLMREAQAATLACDLQYAMDCFCLARTYRDIAENNNLPIP